MSVAFTDSLDLLEIALNYWTFSRFVFFVFFFFGCIDLILLFFYGFGAILSINACSQIPTR